jgi:hypothetical protein
MPSEAARERWLALEPTTAEALQKLRDLAAAFDEAVTTNTKRSNRQRHAIDQAIANLRRVLDLFAPGELPAARPRDPATDGHEPPKF